ncbi:hypothetical protein HJG60_008548 [Phyllostomus discolor]|uniref:Uncharacterized protein n=1 Tax=Phyllostomus discolor TaxID=89673 RepID=A0A833Z101_9CHIR|nr:hypothetical protein HJG60_008548 [Phyllostomus discolor]
MAMTFSPPDSTAIASLHFPNGLGGLGGWPWLHVRLLFLSPFGDSYTSDCHGSCGKTGSLSAFPKTSVTVKAQRWTLVCIWCQGILSVHVVNTLVTMHLVGTMILREEQPGRVWGLTCMQISGRCWKFLNRFRSSEKTLPCGVGRAWL